MQLTAKTHSAGWARNPKNFTAKTRRTRSCAKNYQSDLVDILQILFSTGRFSKIQPLHRSIGYPQMRYRQDTKDAKLREEENKI
ncbi:MAG: hypothetical protein ABSH08_21170 [Tepidisphaeraceae bacterium]|jgi:hypothetical protein